MNWNEILSVFVEGLLKELIPIVVPVVWGFVAAWVAKIWAQLPENQQKILKIAVVQAVLAVEQAGYEDKQTQAVNRVKKYLQARGINIDVAEIVDAIEAEVRLLQANKLEKK